MAGKKQTFKPYKPKRSKYGVDISEKGKKNRQYPDYYTGETIQFDSELELDFYKEVVIKGLEDGSIAKVELQKKYQLQPSFKYKGKTIRAIYYVADFCLTNSEGKELVVDTKGGLVDSVAKLKKKMMHYTYPDINYVWMSYRSDVGWVEWDELEKLKRDAKKAKKKI